jgi:hypothetical protein
MASDGAADVRPSHRLKASQSQRQYGLFKEVRCSHKDSVLGIPPYEQRQACS